METCITCSQPFCQERPQIAATGYCHSCAVAAMEWINNTIISKLLKMGKDPGITCIQQEKDYEVSMDWTAVRAALTISYIIREVDDYEEEPLVFRSNTQIMSGLELAVSLERSYYRKDCGTGICCTTGEIYLLGQLADEW